MSSAPQQLQIAALIGAKGINYRGNWASGTTYGLADSVSYSGSCYYSVVAGNIGNQPNTDSGANWAPLALGSTNFMGPWNPSVSYPVGAIVTRPVTGIIWSFQAIQPSTNIDPATDGGVHWEVIAQGGATGPAGAGARSINRFINFGDSYSANGYPTVGTGRQSNGLTFAELMASTLGLVTSSRYTFAGVWASGNLYGTGTIVTAAGVSYVALQPTVGNNPATDGGVHWKVYTGGTFTGFNNTLGWDNYACQGADLATIPDSNTCIAGQINLFKSDFGNTIPSGALLYFGYTLINDILKQCQSFGGITTGAPDPITTLATWSSPGQQPAIGSTIVGIVASATNLVVNGYYYVAGCGLYQLTALTGTSGTFKNLGAAQSTTVLAPGATLPTGGNIRMAAAQLIDDEMTAYLALIQGLINIGALTIVINNCPNIAVAPYMAANSVLNFSATASWLNTKLAAKFSGVTGVTINDINSSFQAIYSNPLSYGITLPDLGVQSLTGSPLVDQFLWYDQPGLHPSAATHRKYAIDLGATVNKVATLSAQTLTALNTLNVFPNGNPPAWYTGAGGNFPLLVTSADLRLASYNQKTNPLAAYSIFEHYDKLVPGFTLVEPDGTWIQDKSGSAGSQVVAASTTYATKGYGSIGFSLTAAADRYGQIKSAVPIVAAGSPFVSGSPGPMTFIWRVAIYPATGDTVIARGGLVDALSGSRPSNGAFFEVSWASGVVSANLVVASSGTSVLMPLTLNTYGTATFITLTFVTDLLFQRYFVYQDGVFLGWQNMGSLPPSAYLFLAQQAVKTVFGGVGISSFIIDAIGLFVTNNGTI